MIVVDMLEQAERVAERKRALGLDDASFAAARNRGVARTPEKRRLLRAIADEARAQGRTPPFPARF